MTISERIAKNAKFLCHKQGKLVADMEKAIGVSTGYFSRVKGKKSIPIETGYKVADFLGIDIGTLAFAQLAKQEKVDRLEAELIRLKRELEHDAS